MLRPYQQEALRAIRDNYVAGVRRQLLVMSTGSGKTKVGVQLPNLIGPLTGNSRLLWLCHREELVDQAYEAFSRSYSTSIEKAGRVSDPSCQVVIASIQTLQNDKRLNKFSPESFGVIALDEAHHGTAESFKKVFRHFNLLPEQDLIGKRLFWACSATPTRPDGKSLKTILDKIVFEKNLVDLMKEGVTTQDGRFIPYLTDLRAFRVSTEADLSSVKVRGGDFAAGELSRAVDTPERNDIAIKAYLKHGENMPVIAFAAGVQHAQDLAECFRKEGIVSFCVHGDMPKDERKAIIEGFRSGHVQCLTSCDALTEGTDLPRASVALFTRPTKSTLQYQQMLGRITRQFPSVELRASCPDSSFPWIKPYGIVIDCVDNTTKHSVCTMASLLELPPAFDFQGSSAIKTKDKFEKVAAQMPFGNISRVQNLDQLLSTVDRVDLFSAPSTPAELVKITKFSWIKVRDGVYNLGLKGKSLEVHENTLGRWELWERANGVRTKQILICDSLKDAIQRGDLEVQMSDDHKSKAIVKSNASWRQKEPTENQCAQLFRRSPHIQKEFQRVDDFWSFAYSQYENGNKAFTRGGVSNMLDATY